jgi:hypothetical protein
MLDHDWYPTDLKVGAEGTPKTCRFMRRVFKPNQVFHYAEFGIWKADTAHAVCQMFPRARLHLFDFHHTIAAAQHRLADYGSRVSYYGNTEKYNDSYNWSLGKLIQQVRAKPFFDYCFLDGAHTYTVDALNFFLCDRLLKVGGYMDFDDYRWRLKGSSLDPEHVPVIADQYTDEQIEALQVKMIIDTVVRPDPRYREVLRNKVFQKIA